MTESWSEAQNLKLIDLFRAYSLIWDKSLDDYRNKDKRELAFDEIGSKMGTTKDIIKRKLHSLRTHYCAEMRKTLRKENYQPVWKYFDSLKFMFKHDDAYGDPLMQNINRRLTIQSYEKSNLNKLKNGPIKYSVAGSVDDDEPTQKQQRIHNDSEGEIEVMEEIGEGFDSVDDFNETGVFRDEFTVFGEHVANELRLLNGYRSIQLALKCKIMRALLEANEALHRSGWNKSI